VPSTGGFRQIYRFARTSERELEMSLDYGKDDFAKQWQLILLTKFFARGVFIGKIVDFQSVEKDIILESLALFRNNAVLQLIRKFHFQRK